MGDTLNKLKEVLEEHSSHQVVVKSGIGPVGLLGVAFVAMKIANVIDWNWIWVLAPFWIPLALAFLTVLILLIVISCIVSKDTVTDNQDNQFTTTSTADVTEELLNTPITPVEQQKEEPKQEAVIEAKEEPLTTEEAKKTEDAEQSTPSITISDIPDIPIAPKVKKIRKPRKKKVDTKDAESAKS